jgi:hypothetical protein
VESPYENLPGTVALAMGLRDQDLTTDNVIISASGPHIVKCGQLKEHLLIPAYPTTSANGVLHLVHLRKNPLAGIESNITAINEKFQYLMSEVCLM